MMTTKVMIVIPARDMCHTGFALSLAQLMLMMKMQPAPYVGMVHANCSSIDKGRNEGTEIALKQNPSHILYIDSDQTFPPDALFRLLNHDLDIVGATSVTRQYPVEFTARNSDGKRVNVMGKTGLIKVQSNGFPFMLIKRRVFDEIGFPWFESKYNRGPGDTLFYRSEDETFCQRANRAGFTVFVDADLSKQVGHIGMKEFTVRDMV